MSDRVRYTSRARRGLALVLRAGLPGLVEGLLGDLTADQVGDVERLLAWALDDPRCELTPGQITYLSRRASELALSRGRGTTTQQPSTPTPPTTPTPPSQVPPLDSSVEASADATGPRGGFSLAWSTSRGGLRSLQRDGLEAMALEVRDGTGRVLEHAWKVTREGSPTALAQGIARDLVELDTTVDEVLARYAFGPGLRVVRR